MNVSLSDHWAQFGRSQVESGRFASEGEVVDEALRLLQQREQAQVKLAKATEALRPAESPSAPPQRKPIWEVFQEIAAGIPQEERDNLRSDASEQHDHYIYGTPKRPKP
jgi:putative addiction module CopG family antidote